MMSEEFGEKEYEELTGAEKKKLARDMGKEKEFLDLELGILDMSKKPVTDSKVNSKVGMPRELPIRIETKINHRRDRYHRVLDDHYRDNTDGGKQKPNIPLVEASRLKKLSARVVEGETKVFLTDKSCRMGICSQEQYQMMGEEHAKKDRKCTMQEVIGMAKELDCHNSSFIKMFNLGEAWGHSARMRESFMGGEHPAKMTILIKDHKARLPNGLYKTRPVVAGDTAFNRGLSEILSDILESTYKARKGRNIGVISTDDLLSRISQLNEKFKEHEAESRDETQGQNVPGTAKDDPQITVVGSDVEALFPSLNHAETGRLCKRMIMESGMEYDNIDVDEMLLYIRMNRKVAGNIGRLENFLPVRAKQGSTEPGMHRNLVKGPHRMKVTPTNKDIICDIVGLLGV